eukprot:g2320.t1
MNAKNVREQQKEVNNAATLHPHWSPLRLLSPYACSPGTVMLDYDGLIAKYSETIDTMYMACGQDAEKAAIRLDKLCASNQAVVPPSDLGSVASKAKKGKRASGKGFG